MTEPMHQTPLVSVIIIFFNAKRENFFEEAIDSIFVQTYDNWELLLADDGSTDESTAIALQYTHKYPEKVRYVEHEGHQNRGMSATRNLGIRHAKGEYIAFLDADDVWLPRKLEQQIPLLQAYPDAAMLYGRTQYWFSWSKDLHLGLKTPSPNNTPNDYLTLTSLQFDTLIQPPTQLLTVLNNKDIYPCTCSVLIRRHIFDKIGGFEEDFQNANEDMVFHSKLFLRFPVFVSSQCWDRYRRHSDSYWGRALSEGKGNEAAYIGRLKYLTWLEGYLFQEGIKNPQVWKALKQALLSFRHPRMYYLIDRLRHPSRTVNNLLEKLGKRLPFYH
jgi:glycosyltransferase involved in cell wall biosynthesis